MKRYHTFLLTIVSLLFSQLLIAQCNPAAISFTGTSPTYTFSADSVQPGDTVLWDFEDGTTSSLTNPTHTFTYNGHYWIHLSVQNGNCWDTNGFAINITNQTNPPCDASFTSSNSGNTFTFSLNNPFLGYTYYWTFGDGTTYYGLNPTHTYTNNGTFQVHCGIYTNINSCNASSDTWVNVNSIPCNASFTANDYQGTFVFTPINTPSSPLGYYDFYWDFGDGTTANSSDMNSVYHSYSLTGSYTVTCILIDSVFCSDTSTTSITVSNTTPCDASFNTNGNGPFFTFPLISTPVPSAHLFWDFGDGTIITNYPGGNTASHSYSANGTYTVTCILLDTVSYCSDTVSNQLTVVNYASSTIKGYVEMGWGTPADFGVVYLIEKDSVAGTLTAIDSTIIGAGGYYSFSSVPSGQYFIKAALSPSSTSYSSFLPTYYASGNYYNHVYWTNAIYAISPNNNAFYDFNLVTGTNPGGPAFVGGLISQGANKVGDPIGNVVVMVTHLNGDPISFDYSDVTGHFNISSLPYGDYLLYPEVTGKTTTPMQFTLSASNPNISSFVVEVNSTTVEVSIVSGIEKVNSFAEVSIFPNPVQNSLNIDFGKEIKSGVTIEILDISGRLISSQNFENGNKAIIDTTPLSQGTYLLKLSNQDGSQVFQFVK